MSIADLHDYDMDDWDDFEAAVAARTVHTTTDFTSRNRASRWTTNPRSARARSRGGRTSISLRRFEEASVATSARSTRARLETDLDIGSNRRSLRSGELYDRWADTQIDVPTRHPLAAADLEEVQEFPLHDATDVPTLRLVEQRRRLAALAGVSRRRWTVAAMIVLVGFAIVMVNVSLHVEMARAQFRLTELQQREVAAEKAYDQKRLAVASLESPQRIVDEASKQGMVTPEKVTPLQPEQVPLPAKPSSGDPAVKTNQPNQRANTQSERSGSQQGWQELKPELSRGATK